MSPLRPSDDADVEQPLHLAADERPVAAIFRSPLFNASETFVKDHAAGLRRYRPVLVGLERKGAEPDCDMLVPRSAWERRRIALSGRSAGLAGRLGKFRPVLLHAHFGTDGLLALGLARRLDIPLVTTLHGYDVSRTRAALLRSGRLSWIRYALGRGALQSRGDMFIAVSEAVKRRALALGFPGERTIVHRSGVDLERFRAGDGVREDGLILHVGRLVEKKGTVLLLEAFARVRREVPQARLAIAGDGPLERSLRRRASSLGIGEAVSWLGARPAAEIPGLMAKASLLAIPSVTASDGDSEGLPTVACEAAAASLPVVGFSHSGIPEAVIDGRTGRLVAEGDVGGLAEALAALLRSPGERAEMGRAGRALAEERFDSRRQIERLESLYDEVVRRRRDTKAKAASRCA